MTTPLTADNRHTTSSPSEPTAAFTLAKEALKYVAKFQTPPTPEIYEIWYRFAEGSNPELSRQLLFAVNELKSVSVERMTQLHQQFFPRSDGSQSNSEWTQNIAAELGDLESIIRTQITISDDFDAAVVAVGENLDEDCSVDEIRSCVEAVLATSETMHNQLRDLKSQLAESQANVEQMRSVVLESQKSLQTDPLTGVGNRRFFDVQMQHSIEACRQQPLAHILMLVDLDNFKRINDSFGHAAGDDVLRYVAAKIRQLAPEAAIARYGGDEFAVFANYEDAAQGLATAKQLCEYFASNRLTVRKTGESLGIVTLSIGLALLRNDDSSDSWFDRADKLLYSAKRSGRNCVMAERKLDG
jgi:diguanylate cyclase